MVWRIARVASVLSIFLVLALIALYVSGVGEERIPKVPMKVKLSSRGESPWTGVEMSCVMSVSIDCSNASLAIFIPNDFQITSGEAVWKGSIKAGEQIELRVTILAKKSGNYTVRADGKVYITPDSWFGMEDSIELRVPPKGTG
jgi:hypothetical protein